MNYLMAEGVLARIDGERSSLYSFLQSQAPEQSAVERKSKIMNGTNEERDLIGRREKLKQQEKSRAKWCQLSERKELSIKEAWKSDIPSQSPFFFFFARASAFGPHCTLAVNTLWLKRKVTARTTRSLVCYTAVFRVVKQCSSLLRDDTKNGCVAGYSKSRGKTTDKQRLFLIITIDMLSFRALLSFLSHYCACHIQAMQLRLVSSRTGRRGVISDLDCIF